MILPAVQHHRGAAGRVRLTRIDENDGPGVVHHCQRLMIGQPRGPVPLVACRFLQEFGRPDTEGVRPVLGIATEWPAIEAPRAGGDEALTIGVKQDATAIAILEMGDLPTRVGLPQADASRWLVASSRPSGL